MSFLMGVGRQTFSRYFFVVLLALMVRVSSFVCMFTFFSSTPGSSARTIKWFPSSKMSMSGCLSFVRLGIWGSNVTGGCMVFGLLSGL